MREQYRWAAAAAAALLACAPAWALYKVIGPDGKVTYTDRPPTEAQGKTVPLQRDASAAAADAPLPFGLRAIASRFPVTLYTTPECGPCDEGRQLLRQRGIPFRERIASNDADREAWQRQLGELRAPVLTVGSQQLHGLSASEWNNYLDAAGYPRQSQLPANYAPPQPESLTPRVAAAPAPAAAPEPQRAPEPPPPASGGFRF